MKAKAMLPEIRSREMCQVLLTKSDGNEVQCAGFVIEIYEDEQSDIPLDRITAAVDFELLELSMVEAEQFVKDYIDSERKKLIGTASAT